MIARSALSAVQTHSKASMATAGLVEINCGSSTEIICTTWTAVLSQNGSIIRTSGKYLTAISLKTLKQLKSGGNYAYLRTSQTYHPIKFFPLSSNYDKEFQTSRFTFLRYLIFKIILVKSPALKASSAQSHWQSNLTNSTTTFIPVRFSVHYTRTKSAKKTIVIQMRKAWV